MNTSRVSAHEVFTVLESHDYFKGFERRQKVSAISNRVADILAIPHSTPNLREMVHEYYIAHKSAKWRVASDTEFQNGRLGEYIEMEALRIFWLQKGGFWEQMEVLLKTFNEQCDTYLPIHKDTIGVQLCGKRAIRFEEFFAHLGLRLPLGMVQGTSQADNLRGLWRTCLNMSTSHTRRIPLRKKLLHIPITLPSTEYHTHILKILQKFKHITDIDLGIHSWTTLSRRINAFDYNHITKEDFYKFLAFTEKTETQALQNIDTVMLQYLRSNPDKFYYPKYTKT